MASAPNGDIHLHSPDGHGLWVGDTRVLSDFRLLIDGEVATARVVRPEAGSLCMEATVRGLEIERERYLDSVLHERITITNPGRTRSLRMSR